GRLQKLIPIAPPAERFRAPGLPRQLLEKESRLERTELVFVRHGAPSRPQLHSPRVVTNVEEPVRMEHLLGGARKVGPEWSRSLSARPDALNEGCALQIREEKRFLDHARGAGERREL